MWEEDRQEPARALPYTLARAPPPVLWVSTAEPISEKIIAIDRTTFILKWHSGIGDSFHGTTILGPEISVQMAHVVSLHCSLFSDTRGCLNATASRCCAPICCCSNSKAIKVLQGKEESYKQKQEQGRTCQLPGWLQDWLIKLGEIVALPSVPEGNNRKEG